MDLGHSNVDSWEPLVGLQQLKTLGLTGATISDVDVLASLENLESLDLSGVEFERTSPLLKLAKLRKLDLRGTKVKAEDIRMIVSLLSKCKVSHDFVYGGEEGDDHSDMFAS